MSSPYLTEPNTELANHSNLTDIQGYSEWVSVTQPVISISWDWQIHYRQGEKDYSMLGQPFSNLLLQDPHQQDLSYTENLSVLATWLDTLNWKKKLFHYIQLKYS